MTRVFFCLIVLFSLSLIESVSAQIKYQVSNYTVDYYGGGNQNWDVVLAPDNNVFVANNDGLLVLGNSSSEMYDLPGNTIIRSLAVVRDTVFSGSFEEFGYWIKTKNESYQYHSLTDKLTAPMSKNDEIWHISEHNGFIYFHSFGSLYIYDGSTVSPYQADGASFMYLYPVGTKMISQKIGGSLVEIRGKEAVEIPNTKRFSNEELKSVIPLLKDRFLLATTKNVYTYRPSDNAVGVWNSPLRKELVNQQINTYSKFNGGFAIGTILGGIYLFDPEGEFLAHIGTENRLQNNTVLSLASDASGNLWAGLDKGVDYISFNSAIDEYRNGTPDIGTVYAAEMLNEQLYVGTNQGLFSFEYMENGKFHHPKLIENSQGQVWFLREIDGLLYAGLNNGTYVYRNGKLNLVSDVPGAYNLKDYPGNPEIKLQSTYNDLILFSQDNGVWSKQSTIQDYRNPILFMEFDHLGSIWVGHTIKGIQVLQPSSQFERIDTILDIGPAQGIHKSTNKVFKLDNRIVVATGDSLFEWDSLNERFLPYTLLDGLFTEPGAIESILPAGNFSYWIIKKSEVLLTEIRFNKVDLLYRFLPKAYDFHLPDGYERIIALDNNMHLVGLDDGFAIINLDMVLRSQSTIPEIRISAMELEEENGNKTTIEIKEVANQTIDHGINTITFKWTTSQPTGAFSYFQFKLEGYESEWSSWATTNFTSYKSLAPGKYSFSIRSLSNSGKLTNSKSVSFEVREAWYNTTNGYILLAVIMVLLFTTSRIYVSKRKWKQHGKLLEEEREKMRVAKELAEKEVISLRNEKLESEVENKTSKLAYNTMALLQKNEALGKIKQEVLAQKDELGSAIPAKYFNRLVKLIDSTLEDERDWDEFEALYDQTHDNFFKRLKDEYPDLTPGDLRLCAYLRMNLASKEIAPLLNISVRGVEERRYRLRKRLNLSTNTNLTEMLMTF